jgi:hypothetical protein
MSHVRRAIAGAVCAAAIAVPLLSSSAPPASGAGTTVADAAAYLRTQQLPNGGWDSDPSTQFLTEDVVLAIAEAGQTGAAWNPSEAQNAVQATATAGQDPTNFLAAVGAAATTPGRAAKFLVLVAAPLGMDTTALAATIGDPLSNGAFDTDSFFNNTLYAALAKHLIGAAVPASTVGYVLSKQGADGGWSDGFPGDPEDTDTTSLALQVLVAGGYDASGVPVHRALEFIASQQNADGTWSAFGDESAESTSRASLAISAAGFDPNNRCWRDTALPSAGASPFTGVDDALTSLVHADGSIAGPNAFLPAYGTAQAIQGLERSWLPVVRAPVQACTVVSPVEVTAPPAAPLVLAPAFTG